MARAKPFDDLLYAVKFHLTADLRRASSNQGRVPGAVRRYRNDGRARICGATLSNKGLSLAIVEVKVRKNEIEAAGRQRAASRGEAGNDCDAMRLQELTRDLFCENCVILKVENIHHL